MGFHLAQFRLCVPVEDDVHVCLVPAAPLVCQCQQTWHSTVHENAVITIDGVHLL
jgi:hypothetical protein